MSAAFDKLVAALEFHDHRGARGHFQCPVHDDGTPSLTMTDKGDRVLVHCHGGCDTVDIFEALGLGWPDLFDNPARGKGWTASTMKEVGATVDSDGRAQLGGTRYMPDGQPKTLAVPGSKRDLWPDPATVEGDTI